MPPPLDLEDLSDSMDWISSSMSYENMALISRLTGRIYWSPSDDDDEMPEDIEDGTLYIAVPTKQDLDLGRALAIEFTEEVAPKQVHRVLGFFKSKGAYGKFKALLEDLGLLDQRHQYEQNATQNALREWARENGFSPVSKHPSNDA